MSGSTQAQRLGGAIAPTVREQLREARAKRHLLQEQLQARQLERANKLLESWMVYADRGWETDLWDRLRPSMDPANAGPLLPPSQVTDRMGGRNWPLWRTEIELADLRQRSRVLCATNSYAGQGGGGLLGNIVNYVCGDGCQYEIVSTEALPDADLSQPGHQDPDWLQQQIAAYQDALSGFLRLNRWNGDLDYLSNTAVGESREREITRRIIRDGECFLRLFHQDDGTTHVRFVEPEQIRNPSGYTEQQGWTFGIQHQVEPHEDIETVLAYHVAYKNASLELTHNHDVDLGEIVPAAEIVHVKAPGTDSTIKRGTPLFAYGTFDALERAEKLQRNASIGAAVRAATAEIWQHMHGTSAQITSLVDNLKEASRTSPLTGRTENIERLPPGSVRRIPQGQQLVPQPPDQTASYLTGVQGDLRMAASAACAPEYIASADASNGNYASTREAGTPFVLNAQGLQALVRTASLRVVWRALWWVAQCGKLDPRALSQVDVQAEAANIVQRDSLQRAQEDQISVTTGWKSRKQCALERGHDWDEVQAANAEYEEMHGPALSDLTGLGGPAGAGSGGQLGT